MLEQIDKSLFLFFNSFNSPFWDKVMWTVSGRLTWVPLYLAILLIIGLKYKRKLLVIFPILILTIAITDQVSLQCFKNVFERLRPCHEPSLEGLVHIVNGKCGGKFGFVSSHAANSFGIASISLLFIRKSWFSISILTWASIVAYSRVYLGVHYPGDIVGGAVLGILSGYLVFQLFKLLDTRYLVRSSIFKLREQ